MRKMTHLLPVCALVVAATGATAETYRWSQWQADNEATVVGNRVFVDDTCAGTNQEICFDIFAGGVLMPPKSHLQGIGDGVVEGGNATTGYTPSDLPLTNSLSPMFFLYPDPNVIGPAFADWAMHDPAAIQEWQGNNNVVPLGGFSTPAYPIICNTTNPITSLNQLRGLKIRFPSGANATLAQSLGAIPVNIPAPEIYQAMQTRQIDCAAIMQSWLNIENSLEEVSKSTTEMNWASSFHSPLQALNRDFWKSLSNEQRAEMFKAAAHAQATVQVKYNNEHLKALQDATSQGHIVVEPDATITDAVDAWVAEGVGDMAGVARDTYGVQDPEALFESFKPYGEKWTKIIAGMKDPSDLEELTNVLYENLYSDLDPAVYGMQ